MTTHLFEPRTTTHREYAAQNEDWRRWLDESESYYGSQFDDEQIEAAYDLFLCGGSAREYIDDYLNMES